MKIFEFLNREFLSANDIKKIVDATNISGAAGRHYVEGPEMDSIIAWALNTRIRAAVLDEMIAGRLWVQGGHPQLIEDGWFFEGLEFHKGGPESDVEYEMPGHFKVNLEFTDLYGHKHPITVKVDVDAGVGYGG